jgi:hypothetical protein
MRTHIIEVTQKDSEFNWGKFLLGQFDVEWLRQSELPLPDDMKLSMPLLLQRGWSPRHFIVFDLETGEGAMFIKDGRLRMQLDTKHQIWVCPMMAPFLDWLSEQDWKLVTDLPTFVALDTEESGMAGYRRQREGDTTA